MTYISDGVMSFGFANHLATSSEALYEDETFPQRELAALVIAKVYYQIEEYEESMVFALAAGKLFDLDHPGEFEETILGMNNLRSDPISAYANVGIRQ